MSVVLAPPRRPGRVGLFWIVVGCVTAGAAVTGGLVGLVVGLAAHPATAAFAVLEVAVPSALVAFLLALPVGVGAVALRHISR